MRYGWPELRRAKFFFTCGPHGVSGPIFFIYGGSASNYKLCGPTLALFTTYFYCFFYIRFFLHTVFLVYFCTALAKGHARPSFFYILSYYLCWEFPGPAATYKKNFPVYVCVLPMEILLSEDKIRACSHHKHIVPESSSESSQSI